MSLGSNVKAPELPRSRKAVGQAVHLLEDPVRVVHLLLHDLVEPMLQTFFDNNSKMLFGQLRFHGMVRPVRGVLELTGENLKLVWAEFSTLSQAVLMMCVYISMRTHTHIYSSKLGPGIVLLA
jgi:hypothetical protein